MCCLRCLYRLPRTGYWSEPDNAVERAFWGRIPVERGCALFFFDKGSRYRTLLHKLKYKQRKDIGLTLGKMLGRELLESGNYQTIDTIVPVPLHPKKQYRRGYNQSEQIAAGIAQVTAWEINATALIRTTHTETQTRKTRLERWENVSRVFRVREEAALRNKHILLVDDVITTGATLEACATQLLKVAGCRVSVATLAMVR